MPASNDYFGNHQRVREFPWSLYHGPLEASLASFFEGLPRDRNVDVLVIGCGLMQELDRAPKHLRFTAVDIDERAVTATAAATAGDTRVVAVRRIEPDEDLARLGPFDAAYAKEVIEHIVPARAYLTALRGALEPGGALWLSTPNYGEPWLPLVESTFLELVARISGHTRQGIHPSRFSRKQLALTLIDAGFAEVRVHTAAHRLALVAMARNPEDTPREVRVES